MIFKGRAESIPWFHGGWPASRVLGPGAGMWGWIGCTTALVTGGKSWLSIEVVGMGKPFT